MNTIETVQSADFGIICSKEDEKKIVKNINAFLSTKGYRKMYKKEDRSIQPPERTFRFEYYYCQFLKDECGWYFDLMRNEDLDGKFRFPDYSQFGWTLYTRKTHFEYNSDPDKEKINIFFSELRNCIGFESVVLTIYAQGADRL